VRISERLGPARCKQVGKVFQINEVGVWSGFKDSNLQAPLVVRGRLVSVEVCRNYGIGLVVREEDNQEVRLYE
jgi:hypothetical protein